MHYDYTRFDWDERTWSKIRASGIIPESEYPHTVLIGAFLLWMHQQNGLNVVVSNHKRIAVQAKICLERFEQCPDHFQDPDAPPGSALRRALDYVEWFVCEPDPFIKNKKNLITCFSRDYYYWYAFKAPVNLERVRRARQSDACEPEWPW